MCYRVMGKGLTNMLINRSAGSVFTSGETLDTLVEDIKDLEKRRIGSVGNYVVEGLHEMNESVI